MRGSAVLVLAVAALGPMMPRAARGMQSGTSSASAWNREGKLQNFGALMRTLVRNSPDDCSRPSNFNATEAGLDAEHKMFTLLSSAVLQSLDQASNASKAARDALVPFEKLSAQIATSWPKESLLRDEVSSDGALLILRLEIWNQATFVVYAPRDNSASGSRRWEIAKLGMGWNAPFETLETFSLWPAPSGDPRFLVVKHLHDCMAGMSYDYIVEAYQWDTKRREITRIVKTLSDLSADGPKWKLNTSGKLLQIPYCWSGALHFASAYAPICSLDTYDLSGETIRHVSTKDDPANLAVIARILAGVKAQDLGWVERYCSSARLARRIMASVPLDPFFAEYSSKNLGKGKEQVDLSDDITIEFVLETNGQHRTVTQFRVSNN
jgi:hypothetical protein